MTRLLAMICPKCGGAKYRQVQDTQYTCFMCEGSGLVPNTCATCANMIAHTSAVFEAGVQPGNQVFFCAHHGVNVFEDPDEHRCDEHAPMTTTESLTGRLNRPGPNLQNIPIRVPGERLIRETFTRWNRPSKDTAMTRPIVKLPPSVEPDKDLRCVRTCSSYSRALHYVGCNINGTPLCAGSICAPAVKSMLQTVVVQHTMHLPIEGTSNV